MTGLIGSLTVARECEKFDEIMIRLEFSFCTKEVSSPSTGISDDARL